MMRKVDYLLAARFPILYLYKPIQAWYAILFNFFISFIVLFVQMRSENATSFVSLISFMSICCLSGAAWLMNLFLMDKPSNIRLYRMHRYATMVIIILLIIVLSPYILLPLSFDSPHEPFPFVALLPGILIFTMIILSGTMSDDKDLILGRLLSFILFVIFAILQWLDMPLLIIELMIAGALLYILYSYCVSFIFLKARKSFQTMFTSAALFIVFITLIIIAIASIIVTSKKFGKNFSQEVNFSTLVSSDIIKILLQIDLTTSLVSIVVTMIIVDVERVLISCFVDLPRE